MTPIYFKHHAAYGRCITLEDLYAKYVHIKFYLSGIYNINQFLDEVFQHSTIYNYFGQGDRYDQKVTLRKYLCEQNLLDDFLNIHKDK